MYSASFVHFLMLFLSIYWAYYLPIRLQFNKEKLSVLKLILIFFIIINVIIGILISRELQKLLFNKENLLFDLSIITIFYFLLKRCKKTILG